MINQVIFFNLFMVAVVFIYLSDCFLVFNTGFVSTLPAPSGKPTHEMVGVDCEMVRMSFYFLKMLFDSYLYI